MIARKSSFRAVVQEFSFPGDDTEYCDFQNMTVASVTRGSAALRLCRRWMPLVLVPLLSGCFAASSMVGVREPDLTRIQNAGQRSEVEKVLGKSLWRPGSAKGLSYEIYQFKSAKPPNPLLGTVTLGMDYITLGMMELNVKDLKYFAPVKQLAVAYDGRDRVRSVSRPWSVETAEPARRMRRLIPKDSGVPANARPSSIVQRDGSNPKAATLKWDRDVKVAVDGRGLEGQMAELKPGRHSVSYKAEFGGSVMYGAMVLSYDKTFSGVEMLAGRHYQLKNKRFYPGVGARVDIFWIEDVDSGETLGCSWSDSG